jgi:hypothetical protein
MVGDGGWWGSDRETWPNKTSRREREGGRERERETERGE